MASGAKGDAVNMSDGLDWVLQGRCRAAQGQRHAARRQGGEAHKACAKEGTGGVGVLKKICHTGQEALVSSHGSVIQLPFSHLLPIWPVAHLCHHPPQLVFDPRHSSVMCPRPC